MITLVADLQSQLNLKPCQGSFEIQELENVGCEISLLRELSLSLSDEVNLSTSDIVSWKGMLGLSLPVPTSSSPLDL